MSLLPSTPSVPALLEPGAIPDLPSWKARLTAAGFYLGLGPLLLLFGIHSGDPFIQHHAAQALATILAFLGMLFGYCLYRLAMLFAGPTVRTNVGAAGLTVERAVGVGAGESGPVTFWHNGLLPDVHRSTGCQIKSSGGRPMASRPEKLAPDGKYSISKARR
jgi:hypothetical protein